MVVALLPEHQQSNTRRTPVPPSAWNLCGRHRRKSSYLIPDIAPRFQEKSPPRSPHHRGHPPSHKSFPISHLRRPCSPRSPIPPKCWDISPRRRDGPTPHSDHADHSESSPTAESACHRTSPLATQTCPRHPTGSASAFSRTLHPRHSSPNGSHYIRRSLDRAKTPPEQFRTRRWPNESSIFPSFHRCPF
jgi:hypothetical protein